MAKVERAVLFNTDDEKRDYALRCCSLWCPSVAGERPHDFVTQGRHVAPIYSSCADQPQALAWMMGCTSDVQLNRDDAELGLKWRSQINISEWKSGSRRLGSWVDYGHDVSAMVGLIERLPMKGDCVLIGDYSRDEQEHMLIVRDFTFETDADTDVTRTFIHSFDFGQHTGGKKSSKLVKREWREGRVYKDGKSRAIVGWTDICKVPLSRAAVTLETFEP